MQKCKIFWVMTFVVFMYFSACPHLNACLHSLWFYMTAGMKIHDHLQYKLAQGGLIFLVKKYISCTWSICAEVSGDFHPTYTLCSMEFCVTKKDQEEVAFSCWNKSSARENMADVKKWKWSAIRSMYVTYTKTDFSFTNRALVTRQIVVCPVTLRKKETIGMWTRILISFKNFNDIQKDNPSTVSCTNRRKTVVNLEQELSIQPEVSRSSWSRRNE